MRQAAVALRAVIRAAVRAMASRAAANRQKIKVVLLTRLPPVDGDADLLGRVVEVLVGDGLERSPKGGGVAVAACHDAKGARILVSVADMGTGIPRGSRAAQRRNLRSCRSALKSYGGKLWREVGLHVGAIVTFSVPTLKGRMTAMGRGRFRSSKIAGGGR